MRRRIDAGEWSTGERIAPELALAREYEVSRVTVRQALAELVKDDLLERRRGSGTYVRHQRRPLVYDLNLTLGALATRWRDADFDNRAEVIEAGIVSAPSDELRHRLQLRRSDERPLPLPPRLHQRPGDGALPVVVQQRARPRARELEAPAAGRSRPRSPRTTASLPTRSESELEVVRATREETTLLQVAGDVPLVVVTATTYLPDGRPLEHSQLAWLGDRVRFHVTAYASGAGA